MTQHRICVACLEALAQPGRVKCEDCDYRNGHPGEPPEPFTGLSPEAAHQLRLVVCLVNS
jgi:hypothetical protein